MNNKDKLDKLIFEHDKKVKKVITELNEKIKKGEKVEIKYHD